MKVGLVTFSRAPNFGAFLQCFATNFALKKKDVIVENFDPNLMSFYSRTNWRPQNFVYRAQSKSYIHDRKIVQLLPKCTLGSGMDAILKLDAIFIGSDQVLNPNCIQDGNLDRVLIPSIFDIPKFGLAMSTYSNENLEMAGKKNLLALSDFTKLSFREEKVAQWIHKEIGLKGQVLPDPCFLLTAEDLTKITLKSKNIMKSNTRKFKTLVAGYDLQCWSPDIVKLIDLPWQVRYLNFQFRQAMKFGIFTGGPLEVLNDIMQAEVIVTNSFHFAVAGVIAQKRVILPFGNEFDGGERLRNLSNLLGFVKLRPNIMVYDPSEVGNLVLEKLRQSLNIYINECLKMASLKL